MSRAYLPIPDEMCLTDVHFTALMEAQWSDNALHLRATRGACAASENGLAVLVPTMFIGPVAWLIYQAHPDETHVAVRCTWGVRGLRGATVDWWVRSQSLVGAAIADSQLRRDSLVPAELLTGRARTVAEAWPDGPYSRPPAVSGSWLVLAHNAALPRDRRLIVSALDTGMTAGGVGGSGDELALLGVFARGLRLAD